MRVCLDLVAGHTSINHPWFKASAEAKTNKYSNWYIWTDNAWKGPGDNLEGIKGCYERDGVFVTNFFAFQPALNYGFARPDPAQPWQLPVDHPAVKAVRREMMHIMRYWLDRGADGFRVDMASSLVKGDIDYKETMAYWQGIRSIYDRDFPEAALIAEWSFPSLALAAGFHVDFMIHFNTRAYTSLFRNEAFRDVFRNPSFGGYGESFFDRSGRGDITVFLADYLKHYKLTQDIGYISIPSGNHDLGRLSTGRTMADLKVAFTFLLTMPGTPYIYMGDEIGMRQIEDLQSKEGGYGRTGARTPMQWNSSRNAGFSSRKAGALYLPIDPSKDRPTVEQQTLDQRSLLNHVRALTRLRKAYPALAGDGNFTPLYAQAKKYPFVYLRTLAKQKILVAVNPCRRPVKVEFEAAAVGVKAEKLLGQGVNLRIGLRECCLVMKGISYGIFLLG